MAGTEPDHTLAWAKAWQEQDFSWKGLALHPWEGWWVSTEGTASPNRGSDTDRPATLQDYWRAEEGRLIKHPRSDVAYTRFHLPFEWPDGAPTPKSNAPAEETTALLDAVVSRIREAVHDPAALHDQRAQLQGVVLPGGLFFYDPFREPGAASGRLAIRGDHMRVRGQADFEACVFAAPCSFDNALFEDLVWLRSAEFGRSFRARAATFVEGIQADAAQFADGSNFAKAVFRKAASFEGARFAKAAIFNECQFEGVGVFDDARFESASFVQATFQRDARFDKAEITKTGDFRWAIFCDDVWFRESRFSAEMWFRQARFERTANFEDCRFPVSARHFTGAFRFARFKEPANFGRKGFKAFAAFDEAIFEAPPGVEDAGREADKRFRAAIRSAEIAIRKDVAELRRRLKPQPIAQFVSLVRQTAFWRSEEEKEEDEESRPRTIEEGALDLQEKYLGALEGGARVLKTQMEMRRARSLEQRFYRYELLARRRRPSTPPAERLASMVFEQFAEFGDDYLRPLLWLLGLTAGFAGVYWLASSTVEDLRHLAGRGTLNGLLEAFSFSGRNVFRPFGVWTAEREALGAWAFDLLEGGPAAKGLAMRLLASLQSLSSIVLGFLLGLALRRKFQIT